MKPKYFIYSESQLECIKSFRPGANTKVFIGGKFMPYTEMNDTGKSNFDDAVVLGVAPNRWIKVSGVIQDNDLRDFLYQQPKDKAK